MKVFLFDLLAYGRWFDNFHAERYIPYPLGGQHFDAEVAAKTYEEHLAAWEEMDRLGFDGVGLNEHHTTPHGLMNSPNMMAAAAAQRTKKLKFLMLGNLLPLHNPLRVAEELAMADCISRGRVMSGIARGNAREYGVYNIPMAESRGRFEEAYEILIKAWTEDVFSFEGKYWQLKDIAIWPRPYQKPYPQMWVPFTGSRETIEWAGKHNIRAVFNDHAPGLTEDVLGLYARSLAANGHQITPDHLCLFTDAFVAENKARAVEEASPSYLYFVQTLWHHGTVTEAGQHRQDGPGYVAADSYDYIRPENRGSARMDRGRIRQTTLKDVQDRVASGRLNWGSPKDVADHLIEMAERAGAENILLNMNVGAMPHETFLTQIRRFGKEVLPRLQAHQIKRVPVAA